jgi:uncharacterized membrane protein
MAAYWMKIFWALVVHVALALVGLLLIHLVGGNESALSTLVREDYADRPEMIESIRADAVAQLVQWLVRSLAASWLFASLWLASAQRFKPRGPAEGTRRQGLWVMLLLATLVATIWFGWSLVYGTTVAVELASSTVTAGMLIVAIATLLGYFLGTGMNVKATMRPSVPLGGILPSFPGTRQ